MAVFGVVEQRQPEARIAEVDESVRGHFEFRGIPFGTYQLLVQVTEDGGDVTWSRIVDVQTNIPIFVDLGKPAS